jgi:hypothetical protein
MSNPVSALGSTPMSTPMNDRKAPPSAVRVGIDTTIARVFRGIACNIEKLPF